MDLAGILVGLCRFILTPNLKWPPVFLPSTHPHSSTVGLSLFFDLVLFHFPALTLLGFI